MRVKYIFLFCVFSFLFGNTQNIDVTFSVDMQYETVSVDGVYLAGSMQSWIPSSTQMLDGDGDGVYEVTLTLNVNSSYEYKFINGNAWGYDEILASWEGCSAGNGNRLLVTSTVNQILPAYIFNSCNVVTFYGCTDSLALNYDVLATNNDGSCLYCQATNIDSISTNFSCPGDTIFIYGDSFCSHMKVHLQGWTIPDSLVLSSTLNKVVWIFPEVSFPVYGVSLRYIDSLNISSYTNILNISNGTQGCLDSLAVNYDSLATCDDGTCIYSCDPCVDLVGMGNIIALQDDGTVLYNFSNPVAGFQFDVTGAAINLANGGDADNLGFSVSYSTNMVLGYSMSAGVIPVGCGILTNLTLSAIPTGITNLILSDPSAVALSSSSMLLDCTVYGCTDMLSCNYNSLATDDNGSCYYLNVDLGNDTILCPSSILTLSIDSTYDLFSWNTSDTSSQITISNSGMYNVVVFDSLGCSSADTIFVHYSSLPLVDIGNDKVLCLGDSLVLDAGSGWNSYLWSDGSTLQELMINFSGLYSVTITDSIGCSGSDYINVTSGFDVVAGFSYIINGLTVDFIDTSSFGDSYSWDFLSNGMYVDSTFGNVSFTFPAHGIYNVSLIVVNDCNVDTFSTQINLSNTNIDFINNELIIYPNPTSDYLYIRSNILSKKYSYNIFDLKGSLLISERLIGNSNIIDLSILQKGVYFISFNNNTFIFREKIIIY